jgi:flagellar basal-body rod protein FlgF
MLRGIYTSASGMLADQKRLDVVANNLANASTTGFKRDTTISKAFGDFLIERVNDRSAAGTGQPPEQIGRLGIGTYIVNSAARLTTGSLRPTGSPLDVAIGGDGFFTVQTPQGIRYTRQGNFLQDAEGTLVTPEGNAVLVDGAPAQAEPGTMTISEAGEVRSGDQVLGRLSIATSRDLGAIRKEGNGLWVQAGAGEASSLISPAEADGAYTLRVGFLEASNVEAVAEMVEMIATMRSFEANQKALQAQDETLQQAASQIGRIG